MRHEDETRRHWNEIAWIESVCDRWEDFFCSLLDESTRAEALCQLGLELVQGHTSDAPQSATALWIRFFTSLLGKPGAAQQLCSLGLDVVRGEVPANRESTRTLARSILRTQGHVRTMR